MKKDLIEDVKNKLKMLNDDPDHADFVIRNINTWEEMYYLHPARKNVLRFLDLSPEGQALEIGGDGGVYTDYLSRMVSKIISIDPDEDSVSLNRIRCQKLDNVEIIDGDISSLAGISEKFDYVFLHKGFTEPGRYIGSDDPYRDILKKALDYLKTDGKLILITENRLGMRYFAGVKNRLNGKYFSSLEGYSPSETKKSFSKKELADLLKEAGYKTIRFYYPYPDDHFTKCVYSDEYLPRTGELTENIRNFDDDRIVLFNEGMVFDSVVSEDRFREFSNAFLILASREGE